MGMAASLQLVVWNDRFVAERFLGPVRPTGRPPGCAWNIESSSRFVPINLEEIRALRCLISVNGRFGSFVFP
jgi:hypothetical protein